MKPVSYFAISSLGIFVLSLCPFFDPSPAVSAPITYESISTTSDSFGQMGQVDFTPKFDYFEQDRRILPDDNQLHLALQHIQEGKFSEAESITREYLDKNAQAAPAYEILGVAQAKLGDLEGALLSLQKAVELSPTTSSAITKLGDVYLAKADKGKALTTFSKAVNVNPNDYRAHQRLGILYDQAGNHDLAINHYEKGLSQTPSEYVGTKVDLARLYNKNRSFNKTIDLLGSLITPESNNVPGLIILGTAYLTLDQNEKAENLLKKAATLNPVQGSVALGVFYRHQGDYDKSLSVLQAAQVKEPMSASILFQLGESYVQSGQYPEALKSYEMAKEAGFEHRTILRKQAQIYVTTQKFSQAIAIYEGLLADNLAQPADYVALGEAYRFNNKIKNAENVYQKLTTDYPDIAFSWYRSGLFHGYTMEYEKAIDDFHTALRFQENDRQILKGLAVAYSQAGNNEKAIKTARVIVDGSPNNPNDAFYLASLLEDGGETKDAEKLYESVLKLQGDHVLALNNLASILADRQEYDRAFTLASKAVALAPKNARLLDTLGWIEYKKGRYKEAITILSNAIENAPDVPVIYFHLGASFHADGKDKAAKKYLEKALEAKTSFSGIEEAKKLVQIL